eukprot:8115860-Ditylum_brightwellii.AAC.1
MTLLPPVVPSTHYGLSPGPSSSPSEPLPALACYLCKKTIPNTMYTCCGCKINKVHHFCSEEVFPEDGSNTTHCVPPLRLLQSQHFKHIKQ